jgi:hypothetical protein
MQIINTDWIITTDADCVVNKTGYWPWTITFSFMMLPWLPSGNVYLWQFILHHFQQLDIASLQGATIGSFGINKGFMCNGANFAYTKSFSRNWMAFMETIQLLVAMMFSCCKSDC